MDMKSMLYEHILLGKKLTLQFPSQKNLTTFKSMLYTYKRREEKLYESLGGELKLFCGKELHFEKVTSSNEVPIIVNVYLRDKQVGELYKILDVQ